LSAEIPPSLATYGPVVHRIDDNRPSLLGASKDAIRDHFRPWISTRSVERDGPGADKPRLADIPPRYRACFYVDKEVMESATLTEYPLSRFVINPTGFHLKVGDKVVLIDAQYGEHYLDLEEEDLEEGEYDRIEGRTSFDVGWQYVRLPLSANIYDTMCQHHDAWVQPYFFQRPPGRVWGRTIRLDREDTYLRGTHLTIILLLVCTA